MERDQKSLLDGLLVVLFISIFVAPFMAPIAAVQGFHKPYKPVSSRGLIWRTLFRALLIGFAVTSWLLAWPLWLCVVLTVLGTLGFVALVCSLFNAQ